MPHGMPIDGKGARARREMAPMPHAVRPRDARPTAQGTEIAANSDGWVWADRRL